LRRIMKSENLNSLLYTLEEACQNTGMPLAEIRRLISQGEVSSFIYSGSRKYLIYSRSKQNQIIGHGHCIYRGPLSVHRNFIESLLDNQNIKLSTEGAKPIDMTGISNWNTGYPYSCTPIGKVVDWEPLELTPDVFGRALMMPFPSEIKTISSTLRDTISGMPEENANSDIGKLFKAWSTINPNNVDLNYHEQSVFSAADLLIQLPGTPSQSVNFPAQDEQENTNNLPDAPAGKRVSQIRRLLWSVLINNLDLSAKQIWKKLEHDWMSDDPEYDSEDILRSVEADRIIWEDRKGTERTLKLKNYENRLSDLRAVVKNIREKKLV